MKIKYKIIMTTSIMLSIIAILVCAFMLSIYFFIFKTNIKFDVNMVSAESASPDIKIKWDSDEYLSKIKVDIKYYGKLISSYTTTDPIILKSAEYNVKACYGKVDVTVTGYRGWYNYTQRFKTDVYANTYNIAPLIATMPVTLFTLKLDEITANNTIPTFVWFDRGNVWNYNYAPSCVFTMPGITASQLNWNGRATMYEETGKYISELYSINPNSFFNYYINDIWSYGYYKNIIANNIPMSNHTLTMITDGTATSELYNQYFNNEDDTLNDKNYNDIKEKIEQIKSDFVNYNGKDYLEIRDNGKLSCYDFAEIGSYFFVLANEQENAKLWINNAAAYAPNSAKYKNLIRNNPNVEIYNFNTLLNEYTDQEKLQLKNLLGFADDCFSEAQKNNKEVMMVLGTANDYEGNMDKYVKTLKAYYGDKYLYYYKGHPGYPTYRYDGKSQNLKDMGLIEIDATVPAEFYLFFNPKAISSGYSSTTFDTVVEGCGGGLFESRLKDTDLNRYEGKIEFTMTYVDKTDSEHDNEFDDLCQSDSYVILEFLDTTDKDISIFDLNTSTFTSYRKNADDTYTRI